MYEVLKYKNGKIKEKFSFPAVFTEERARERAFKTYENVREIDNYDFIQLLENGKPLISHEKGVLN